MSRPCSVCISSNRAEIELSVITRISIRETARTYGVSASAISRHVDHSAIEPAARAASHLAVADELIAAVKVVRGTDFSAQDAAEAAQLRGLAEAVDASPTNIGALRELRLTLDGFRRSVFHVDPSEQAELAELVARIAGPTDASLYGRTYAAAVAAGASEQVAEAAANAAVGRGEPTESWHEAMARIRPER